MGMMKIDRLEEIVKAIDALAKKEVLVGIPDSNADRKDGESAGNAQIGYVQETGSPANNLPARPFLVPGVADVQGKVAARLGKGAQAALDGDLDAAERQMGAAGMIASSSAKRKINSNIAPALSPETIRNRHKSRGTASMRKSEKEYLAAVAGGSTPSEAQSAAGIVSLVNTGQLRNAITYVIRKK